MAMPQDYFVLFALPPDYDIDLKLLRERYRRLRSELHPDRYAAAGKHERARAEQYSSQLQQAFRVLEDPLRRAAYLLERAGHSVDAEAEIVSDKDFLLRQMEWRDRLEELAQQEAPTASAAALKEEIGAARREHDACLRRQLRDGALHEAADTLARLRFLHKLEQQSKQMLTES